MSGVRGPCRLATFCRMSRAPSRPFAAIDLLALLMASRCCASMGSTLDPGWVLLVETDRLQGRDARNENLPIAWQPTQGNPEQRLRWRQAASKRAPEQREGSQRAVPSKGAPHAAAAAQPAPSEQKELPESPAPQAEPPPVDVWARQESLQAVSQGAEQFARRAASRAARRAE